MQERERSGQEMKFLCVITTKAYAGYQELFKRKLDQSHSWFDWMMVVSVDTYVIRTKYIPAE